MPLIPTYTAEAAQGVPNLQDPQAQSVSPLANASQFYTGGAEGLDLQPLISGIDTAARVLDELDQQKERAWVVNETLKQRLYWTERTADPETSPTPEQYRKEFEKQQQAIIKYAPSGRARDMLVEQTNMLGLSLYDNVIRNEVAKRERARKEALHAASEQMILQAQSLTPDQILPFLDQYGNAAGMPKAYINGLYKTALDYYSQDHDKATELLQWIDSKGGKLPGLRPDQADAIALRAQGTFAQGAIVGETPNDAVIKAQEIAQKYPRLAPELPKLVAKNRYLIDNDPAAWADNNPSIKALKKIEAEAHAAYLSNPTDPEALKQWQAATQAVLNSKLELQESSGRGTDPRPLPQGYGRLLTKAEATQLAKALTDNDGVKAAQEIEMRAGIYGKEVTARMVAEANQVRGDKALPPAMVVLTDNIDKPWLREVIKRDREPELPKLHKATVTDSLINNWRVKMLQASVAPSGVSARNQVDTYVSGIKDIAIKSYGIRQGYDDPVKAAELAVEELIPYNFVAAGKGVVKIPKSVQATPTTVAQALNAKRFEVELDPEILPQARGATLANSAWFTTNDDKGVQLYYTTPNYPLPVPALDKNKQPIVVRWAELQDYIETRAIGDDDIKRIDIYNRVTGSPDAFLGAP